MTLKIFFIDYFKSHLVCKIINDKICLASDISNFFYIYI